MAASTFTCTPKSASLRLDQARGVFGVSLLTVSVAGGPDRAECSGGNWPPMMGGNSMPAFRARRAAPPFGHQHLGRRRFDDDRLRAVRPALSSLDHFALLRDFLLICRSRQASTNRRRSGEGFQQQTQFSKAHSQDMPEKNAPAGRHQGEQEQRGTGVAQLGRQQPAQFDAEAGRPAPAAIRPPSSRNARPRATNWPAAGKENRPGRRRRMLLVLVRCIELAHTHHTNMPNSTIHHQAERPNRKSDQRSRHRRDRSDCAKVNRDDGDQPGSSD